MKATDPTEVGDGEALPEIVTLNAPSPTTVSATFGAYHWCPFKDEQDIGTVTIAWAVVETTIELHSLAAWLDSLDEWFISHEAYTYYLRETLQAAGVHVLSVVSHWPTAGGEIVVSA